MEEGSIMRLHVQMVDEIVIVILSLEGEISTSLKFKKTTSLQLVQCKGLH